MHYRDETPVDKVNREGLKEGDISAETWIMEDANQVKI